jgi:hypothetical protein
MCKKGNYQKIPVCNQVFTLHFYLWVGCMEHIFVLFLLFKKNGNYFSFFGWVNPPHWISFERLHAAD